MQGFFNRIRHVVIGLLVIWIVQTLVWYLSMGKMTWQAFGNISFYNFYYGIPLFFANSIPSMINPSFDLKRQQYSWKRLLTNFLLGMILTVVFLMILNYILRVVIEGNTVQAVFDDRSRGSYVIGLIISVIVSLTYHSYHFYQAIKEITVAKERLESEKIKSEHQSLRAHIDPHFLFNSFNVLSGLIDEDTEKAQHFLSRLSKVYRHVLENRESESVMIADELSFARMYVDLLQMRFEDSICLKANVQEAYLKKKITPLSLQLLIENAVKHNAFNKRNVLVIEIYVEEDYLVVRNNVTPKTTLQDSTGFGLENINKQYQLLTQKSMIVEDTSSFFTVKLPII